MYDDDFDKHQDQDKIESRIRMNQKFLLNPQATGHHPPAAHHQLSLPTSLQVSFQLTRECFFFNPEKANKEQQKFLTHMYNAY